jgi:hypothetical protein
MEEFIAGLAASLGTMLPNILAALAILVIGWLIAYILASVVRKLLHRTNLDNRIANMVGGGAVEGAPPQRFPVERLISGFVFWLVILLTVIAVLQILQLAGVIIPLSNVLNQILAYLPRLLLAAILFFIAWLVATLLRTLTTRVISASGITRRVSEGAEMRTQDRVTIGQTIGNVVYWLVFLLFLPAILDALNLQGILAPVQEMVTEIVGILPNLLGAALILGVGYLIARIIRQIVTNLLASVGVDRWGAQASAPTGGGGQRLSEVIGTVVFVLVLIPIIIAALNALDIPAISVPASEMLTNLLIALPAIFGAILIIAIAYFVARIVGRFVADILAGIGFNRLFARLGLGTAPMPGEEVGFSIPREELIPQTGAAAALPSRVTPAQLVGYIVTIAIVLFAVMEAANLLGFEILAVMVSGFIEAVGRVLVGVIIFGLGLYLASWADSLIRSSGASQAHILAPAARYSIIIFSAALALRQMGIAESIVNLAFGLLLGALAVAAALAFGLGGREIAARWLERWQQQLRERTPERPMARSTTPPPAVPPSSGPSGAPPSPDFPRDREG